MKEYELTDEGAMRLMAGIIKMSLYDLFRKPITRKPKNEKDAKKIASQNYTIEKRRKEAHCFFYQSTLFKATNLDLEYLITKYQETKGRKKQ